MSLLQGVPEFGRPLDLSGRMVYPAWEDERKFIYIPAGLDLSPRRGPASGLDFSLELVRGQNPFLPPTPYGVLDFRLSPQPVPVSVLDELRQTTPTAILSPAIFARGYLRLVLQAGSDVHASEFELPVQLASNGLDSARYIRRLTPEAVALLKRVLQEGTLTFIAIAEMEVIGLAPRVPLRLEFRSGDLHAALEAVAGEGSTITSQALQTFWMRDPSGLPVQVLGDLDSLDRLLVAEALADWTADALAEIAPFLPGNPQPTYKLQAPGQPEQILRWDLSEGRSVPRIVILTLNPFDAVRQVVSSQGLQAVFKETQVPVLETGFTTLSVAANLPDRLHNIVKLGVNLLAPPSPPDRVSPLTKSILLDDPNLVQTFDWRFAPQEPVAYQYSTFAILRQETGIRRVNGQSGTHNSPYLLVKPSDFPLLFVPLQASAAVLAQATIQGVCSFPDLANSQNTEIAFELSASQPLITLLLPPTAADRAEIQLLARALEGNHKINLGVFPARALNLDLFSLPEYGPHTIEIETQFDISLALLAIDFLPEGKSEDPGDVDTVAFTPDKTTATWSYFAASPFQAGFTYRRNALVKASALDSPLPGEPSPTALPAEWSSVQSPFAPLRLQASQFVSTQ